MDTKLPMLAVIERDHDEVARFAKDALDLANSMVVSSTDSLLLANQCVVDIAARIKQVKADQDLVTKPIKDHAKKLDGIFKSILDPLQQSRDIIDRKVVKYRLEQQEAQRQVEAILSAGGEGEGVVAQVTPETQKSIRVDGGQVSYSQKWDFEIVSLDLVEVNLLREVANTKRGREALEQVIRGYVNAGRRVIAGVRIYPTEKSSVRG